jgi:hypothetical protein
MSGFSNKPKILRGAFVEYGLSLPPLFVVFQFNPEQVSRSRSLFISVPNAVQSAEYAAAQRGNREAQYVDLRQYHDRYEDLTELREAQEVSIQEENINFELRLDATDALNEGDVLAEQFGILPQLATLELMVLPKSESLLGAALGALFGGGSGGFSFTRSEKPPLVLFIWGRKRVLPVNINSLSITEAMFSADLNPLRATVNVSLTVIEGKNLAYKYSKAMLEVMSVLNLANIADIANVVIPG